MQRRPTRLATAAATIAATGPLAPAARAGQFLRPQRVIDPGGYSAPQDLAVGPGGAAVLTLVRGNAEPQLLVAVRDQGCPARSASRSR